MKLFSFILMSAIVCAPVLAKPAKKPKQQPKLTRVQSTLQLLNDQLPAGTYEGKSIDDEKCVVKVEAYKTKAGQVDDYAVEAQLIRGEKKEDNEKDTFNLFDDGRDFSESHVVEVATWLDRKEGRTDYVRILEEALDDDGDTSELRAPRLTITHDTKGKLVGVVLNRIECLYQ